MSGVAIAWPAGESPPSAFNNRTVAVDPAREQIAAGALLDSAKPCAAITSR